MKYARGACSLTGTARIYESRATLDTTCIRNVKGPEDPAPVFTQQWENLQTVSNGYWPSRRTGGNASVRVGRCRQKYPCSPDASRVVRGAPLLQPRGRASRTSGRVCERVPGHAPRTNGASPRLLLPVRPLPAHALPAHALPARKPRRATCQAPRVLLPRSPED